MYISLKIPTGLCKAHGVRTEAIPDGVSETKCEAFIELVPLSKDNRVKAVVYLHAFTDEDDVTTASVHDIESTLNPICMELDGRGRCIGISDHDKLCKRWDDRPFLLHASRKGEWVEKELQSLIDRVHDEGFLLNITRRYYVFSGWVEVDWSGVEFTGGEGRREYEDTVPGVSLLFLRDCSFEDTEEEISLHIIGSADLKKNKVQFEKISFLDEAQIEDTTPIEQHYIVKTTNLTEGPQIVYSHYTVKEWGQMLRDVEISLTFQ